MKKSGTQRSEPQQKAGDPGNVAANAHTYFVQEYGGGIDYHVSKHVNAWVADGEYQR